MHIVNYKIYCIQEYRLGKNPKHKINSTRLANVLYSKAITVYKEDDRPFNTLAIL